MLTPYACWGPQVGGGLVDALRSSTNPHVRVRAPLVTAPLVTSPHARTCQSHSLASLPFSQWRKIWIEIGFGWDAQHLGCRVGTARTKPHLQPKHTPKPVSRIATPVCCSSYACVLSEAACNTALHARLPFIVHSYTGGMQHRPTRRHRPGYAKHTSVLGFIRPDHMFRMGYTYRPSMHRRTVTPYGARRPTRHHPKSPHRSPFFKTAIVPPFQKSTPSGFAMCVFYPVQAPLAPAPPAKIRLESSIQSVDPIRLFLRTRQCAFWVYLP